MIEGMLRKNFKRATKHFIIATNQGVDLAVKYLKDGYNKGHVSKCDFGEALRAHQRAVDATKSQQREEAGRNPEYLTRTAVTFKNMLR